MAKGKHAAALFEVIHSGRFPNKPEMRTPKWWFKRKDTEAANSKAQDQPAPSADAPQEDPADPTTGASARAMRGAVAGRTTELQESSNGQSAAEGSHSVDVSVDPKRRQITFRVTYSSAMVTAFAIVVVVGLAYVVGRKVSRGPSPAVASETTEQIRARPPRPDVLNVTPTGNTQGASTHNGASPSPPAPREAEGGVSAWPSETHQSTTNPPTVAPDQGRIVGTNYLVIQSYPDEKTAIEVRDLLLQSGIGCTVENQKLRGLNTGWFHVVGTQGFIRISGADYDAYYKRLEQLSRQIGQGKRSFKGFALLPYKWDKAQQ
jgi:hypothetical protein